MEPIAESNPPAPSNGAALPDTAAPACSSNKVENRDALASDAPGLARMEKSLASMHQILEARLQYDAAKEEAFNRLYAELDAEKKKNAGDTLKPVIRDLVLLHDHLTEAIQQNPESASTLEMIRQGLIEVLSRAGAEAMGAPLDNRFDRTRQSVKAVVKTDVPDQDWLVTRVVKEGFLFQGLVLRPQQVEVRRFNKPPPAAAPAGGASSTLNTNPKEQI